MDCYEKAFNLDISQSSWPSAQYFVTAQMLYGFNDTSDKTNDQQQERLKEDLLQVQIFFQSLNVQV